ncbi:MAG: methyltransferase domain-containing protein, partial [Gammaproteobacteria bacterium]
RLADQLIERYAPRGKDILEIGHGGREFLELLCELGANHGIGFDARHAPQLPPLPAGIHVAVRQEPLVGNNTTAPSDLICSKSFLQTVAKPAQFLDLLKRTLDNDARLLLQVSNFVRTLKNCAFWEINYSSCSYFSPGTLYRLLRAQSFVVNDVWTDFDAEYLMADARATAQSTTASSPGENIETIADLAALVARFASECRERQAMWCEILRKLAGGGNRIAIWGAGSRTASFLTTLAVGDEVSYVVDINPGRQGKFTPGTGHRIVAPDVMVSMRPDVVIVVNSVLAFEIRDLLTQAGCAPTLLIA